jgi:hypothetical protein
MLLILVALGAVPAPRHRWWPSRWASPPAFSRFRPLAETTAHPQGLLSFNAPSSA